MGIGENAAYEHFLLFIQCFSEAFFFKIVLILGCMEKGVKRVF